MIARPCDAILLVNHTEPCDISNYTLVPITEAPSLAPTVAAVATPPPSPYAFCGDCFCINGDADCPTDQIPQMEFSEEYVAFLQSLEVTNPYDLNCNPYEDDSCEATPTQNLTDLGDDAACGVKYDMTSVGDNQCPTKYSLVSYESVDEAEADGATVTHHGACGVCSTTQDLAVYIQYTDLVDKGTECSIRGIVDFDDGVLCYTEVGYTEVCVKRIGAKRFLFFTGCCSQSFSSLYCYFVVHLLQPCAKMWVYNGYNTRDNCLGTCIRFTVYSLPNNAPPPECTIAECLQCDEDESGPLFAKVAARSRRRSGLLSTIARPCDDILSVNHTEPCDISDYTLAPVEAPTVSPESPTVPSTMETEPPTTSGGETAVLDVTLKAVQGLVFFTLARVIV